MRRILASLALTVAVVGCGGSSTSDSNGVAPTSTERATTTEASTTEASTTEATTATSPTAAEAPDYRLFSEDDLAGVLLGLQDLPAGYSEEPPDTDDSEKTFCDYEPPFKQEVEASRDFVKGGGRSAELLRTGLRQYASPEEAKAAFDALTDALASCTDETWQGIELTYTPMSAPKVGDGSVGVKINADGTDLLQFFAVVGPTLVNTGGGGLMNANADEVTSLLEAQVNAYESAAAG